MDTLKWRPKANVVAIVYWVFAAITCIPLLLFIVAALKWGSYELTSRFMKPLGNISLYDELERNVKSQQPESEVDEETLMSAVNILSWLFYAAWVALAVIDVVACWKLWVSCKQSCEEITAVKNARFWRTVRILYQLGAVLYILKLLFMSTKKGNIIMCLFVGMKMICDLGAIYIVQMFINEVRAIATARQLNCRRGLN